MVLREATYDDIPTLVTLIHTAFEEYRGRLEPPSGAHRETAQSIGTYLQQGRAVLALLHGQIVGCVCYHQEGEHVYFGRLAVLPAFRQHGVGLALIAYVEQQAHELGAQRVQIGVRIALTHLQAYYEHLGYHVVRYETHEGYTEPTSVVMEKQVL
jgi:N-acetylglutamate synthase-like GNAT family acetyltransferase